MKIPFLFSQGNLTVVLNGQSKSVPSSHPNFKLIREALKNDDAKALIDLIVGPPVEPPKPVPVPVNMVKDRVKIVDGKAYFDDEFVDCPGLDEYIQNLVKLDLPFDGLIKFIGRLYLSVRFRVRNQLFLFANKVGLIIDSQGYLLAYKAVTEDYKDKWTQKIDNRPGQSPCMDPGKVCDDPNRACGPGLHAGGLGYVHGYGHGSDRIIIVRVDPADVVSIPYDSGCQKLRTCGYYVVGDYNGELQRPVYESGIDTNKMYDEDSKLKKQDEEDENADFFDELEDDDDSDFEDDDDNDSLLDDDDDSTMLDAAQSLYGIKPSGQKFHNVRGTNGRFVKKS